MKMGLKTPEPNGNIDTEGGAETKGVAWWIKSSFTHGVDQLCFLQQKNLT